MRNLWSRWMKPWVAADSSHGRSTSSSSALRDRQLCLEVVVEWIPKDAALIDFGRGPMALEGLVSPKEYRSVGIASRDAKTLVVDANRQALTVDAMVQAEWAVLLNVLEHHTDPEGILRELAKFEIRTVCSYPWEESSALSLHLRPSQWTRLIDECGFDIVDSKRVGADGLFLLEPRRMVAEDRSSESEDQPVILKVFKFEDSHSKKRLVLSGFFARGNAGDEALLHVQYEHFSKHFDIVISVEQYGAFQGFWDWYPYNRCQIIGRDDLAIFWESDVIGLHVGGGGLPLAFNASQVIGARAAGKLVQVSGVEIGRYHSANGSQLNGPDTRKIYLDWTRPWLRTQAAYDDARQASPAVNHGSDWGFGLKIDNSHEVEAGRCLLIIREFPEERITPKIRRQLNQLVHSLHARYGAPILLPFCPEDERILNRFESTWGLERQIHWSHPGRIKKWISKASLVVSIGRLHPLIFAASCGTPTVFSELPADACEDKDRNGERKTLKALQLCKEVGIDYFREFSQFLTAIGDPNFNIRSVEFSAAYRQRYDEMTRSVLERFQAAAEGRSEHVLEHRFHRRAA